MDYNIILIRFSEIHLKGGNKKYFLKLLFNNIKQALNGVECKLVSIQNRFLIREFKNADEIIGKLKFVFGIHSISKAIEIDTDETVIKEYVSKLKIDSSFKCEVKRADKSFPIHSNEFAADLGEVILNSNPSSRVDLYTPDIVVSIDIRENGKTYIFDSVEYAYSGLPLSETTDGLLLLSGGIDSPVAGFCMAKRGLRQDIIHFDSFPYTSTKAKDKVITLAKTIAPIIGAKKMYVCSMTKLQEEFHIQCNDEYAINLLRRAMIRVANIVAKNNNYKAIITGESLGQVASQTIESITTTNAVSTLPVLRPLIAMNKDEIIDIAKQINTFETSILPYEDCCTVFLPRNPIIKPKIKNSILEENKVVNYESLIQAVIENIEIIQL